MISRQQLEQIAAAVQGVPVWGCLPGSTAANAGVRYGDIVLEVNGVRTPSIDEYLAARSLRVDGIQLRLLRAGSELTLFVEFRHQRDESLQELTARLAEGRYVSTADPDLLPQKPLLS